MIHKMKKKRLIAILSAVLLLVTVFPVQKAFALEMYEMGVQGTVTDDKGAPLSGYEIMYAFQRNADGYKTGGNSSSWIKESSDSEGKFSFTTNINGYELSDWKLYVRAERLGLMADTVVTIQPGATITVPLSIDTHETFIVHITDQSGNPAPAGVPFWFTYVSPSGGLWPKSAPMDGVNPEHSTNSGGTISFEATGGGSVYPAGTPASGRGPLWQTGDLRYEFAGDPTGLTAHTPRSTDEKTIKVKPLGKIVATARDSVTGNVINTARFTVPNFLPYPSSEDTSFNKYMIDANGVMNIYGFGDITFSAKADSDPRTGYLGYNSGNITDAFTPWGTDSVDVPMVRQSYATIGGIVYNEQEIPVPGAQVELIYHGWTEAFSGTMSIGSTITDANGRYIFDDVIPSGSGWYIVKAVKNGYVGVEDEIEVESGDTTRVNVWLDDMLTGVCEIGATYYDSLDEALAAVENGETITLLKDITDSDGMVIDNGRSFTIDPNGFNLSVAKSGDMANGLEVTNGSAVALDESSGGSFNVSGSVFGVYADDGTVTVSNASAGEGVAVAAMNGSNITVTGDAEGTNGGVFANYSSAENIVTVNGDVRSTGDGIAAVSSQSDKNTIHVFGDVIASGGSSSHGILGAGHITVDGDVEGNQIGAEVSGAQSVITIGGIVTARGTDNEGAGFYCYGALTAEGKMYVNGNISAVSGSGIRSTGGGELTLEGTITAAHYIEFGFGQDKTIKTKADKEATTSKAGYDTYTDGTGEVWVKATGGESPDLDLKWGPSSGGSNAITGSIGPVVAGSGDNMAAINGSGKLIVSANGGRTWSVKDTGSFIAEDIVYDGSKFIAVGNGIMSSADGADWTADTITGSVNWSSDVIYAVTTAETTYFGEVTVACGNHGLILVKHPGQDWWKLNINNPNASDVTFGHEFSYVPGHQVTVGGNLYNISEEFFGFGSGMTWTISEQNITSHYFTTVSSEGNPDFTNAWYENSISGPGKFFALKNNGLGNGTMDLMVSYRGMTGWSLAGGYPPVNGYASGDAGTMVKVGNGGTILTSTNGVDWVSQTVGTSDLNDVIFADGIFVAVGDGGTILTSADGASWHTCTSGTSSDLFSVDYIGGDFVTGGNSILLYTGEAPQGTPPTIDTTSLTGGTVGTAYSMNLSATGDPVITWTIDSGSLPNGLMLSSGGTISGTPTTVGVFSFTVRATNTAGYDTQTLTLTISAPPATTYTVTFNNNNSVYASRTVNAGESIGTVVWPADPTRSDYTFGGWYTGADGAGTQFTSTTAVNAITTVYAKWTYNGGSSSDHGHGGGTTTPTYNARLSGSGSSATLAVTVNSGTNSAAVSLGADQTGSLDGGNAVITVPSIPGVTSYTLNVPASSLSASEGEGTVTLSTKIGSIAVPDNMLDGIPGTEGKTAGITIGQGDKSGLSDEARAAIGDRPLVQLTLTLNGKQTEWNNPDAPVTVSIPYTPTAAELANPDAIVVWYIDGSGNLISVPNGHYDPATGTVTFTTTHFSGYAVGYNKVFFSDVPTGAWYADPVGFIAARGITTGTGGSKFSPDANLTRGEFVVMMMKAYGIAPDTDPNSNFSDAGSAYYTGYLAAAKRLGLSNGVGNNLFAPEKEITRQEMFTLLHNALEVIGRLPEGTSGKSLSDFSDEGQIASWAKDAMSLFIKAEIVGGSNGKLSPAATTTRAEMAQVFYNLLLK